MRFKPSEELFQFVYRKSTLYLFIYLKSIVDDNSVVNLRISADINSFHILV